MPESRSPLSSETAAIGEDVPESWGAALAVARSRVPALDARLLLLEAFGIRHGELVAYPERPVTPSAWRRLVGWLQRRAGGEPVSRILGRREFWSLPFQLSPASLDPRPDTETVVAAALRYRPSVVRRVLDLGTGSGCLLLALLHEWPDATGIGVDRAEEAARTARRNARVLGIGDRAAFLVADWTAGLTGRFAVIVSNPPYITDEALSALPPEVADHDPRLALAGGPDGLSAYRRLLPNLAQWLTVNGILVIEHGYDQQVALLDLAQKAGLAVIAKEKDLAGHPRCLVLGPRQDRA